MQARVAWGSSFELHTMHCIVCSSHHETQPGTALGRNSRPESGMQTSKRALMWSTYSLTFPHIASSKIRTFSLWLNGKADKFNDESSLAVEHIKVIIICENNFLFAFQSFTHTSCFIAFLSFSLSEPTVQNYQWSRKGERESFSIWRMVN